MHFGLAHRIQGSPFEPFIAVYPLVVDKLFIKNNPAELFKFQIQKQSEGVPIGTLAIADKLIKRYLHD